MNTTQNPAKKTASLFMLGAIALSFPSTAFTQGTTFTYQGRLNNGTAPATGQYDFRFKLYLDPAGNTQAGSSYLTNGVAVNSGLFTTAINFGAGLFAGSNCWLEVGVKTNGAASYSVLTPLQAMTPTPYAVFAGSASNVLGAVPAAQLTGTIASGNLSGTYANAVALTSAANEFTGNGSRLTSLNGSALTTGTVSEARIDAAVARDSEIMPIVLANDGAGSGLDADLLDGVHASSFARTNHTHSGVQYFTVGSEAFVPGSNVDYYNTYGNGGAHIVSGTGALVAPVHLPNGAVVTEFRVYYYDNSSADLNVWLQLQRFSAGYGPMGEVVTAGTPGYGSGTDTTIENATIDNTSNSYLIYAYSDAWSSNLMIKAAVVVYSVSTVP
jgi:hypothetical protein